MMLPERDRVVEITFWKNSRGTPAHIYHEPDDWWVGYYRGDNYHYVCIIPTFVIRWRRK